MLFSHLLWHVHFVFGGASVQQFFSLFGKGGEGVEIIT